MVPPGIGAEVMSLPPPTMRSVGRLPRGSIEMPSPLKVIGPPSSSVPPPSLIRPNELLIAVLIVAVTPDLHVDETGAERAAAVHKGERARAAEGVTIGGEVQAVDIDRLPSR